MNDWIAAGISVSAGLLLATLLGRLTQSWLSRDRRSSQVREIAAPLGSLVFSVVLIIGLMTALGFVNREALDRIPDDLVDYLPSFLSGLIVLIGANVVAQLAKTAMARALAGLPGPAAAATIPNTTRMVILVFGAILAAAQLGVDTTVINIVVAAVMFSLALAAALMIGLGSRGVTTEVAAGRAVRRMITVGDTVSIGQVHGTVAMLSSTSVEIDTGDDLVLVPNSQLLGDQIRVTRDETD